MDKSRTLEILGWLGTALVLIGYGLYSTGLIPDIYMYHVMNLIGSVFVATISGYRRVWQPFTINTVMAIFALTAIIRHFL